MQFTEADTKEIAENKPTVFQRIRDWLQEVISKLKGEKYNRTLVEDLEYLNKRLARVYNSAITNSGKGANEKYSVARRSGSVYNEYASNVMQWAHSAGTKAGDIKMFSRNGKGFVLLKATDDGYIELAAGSYKEVKEVAEEFEKSTNTVYVHTGLFRDGKTRHTSDNRTVKNSGEYERGRGPTGSTGLQGNTAGSAEYLRGGNRRESSDRKAGLKESAFSLPAPVRGEYNSEQYARTLLGDSASESQVKSKKRQGR